MIYLVEFEAFALAQAFDPGPLVYYDRDSIALAEVNSPLAGAAGVTLVWDMDYDGSNAGFAGIAFEHSPTSNGNRGFWMSPRHESIAGVGELLIRTTDYNIATYPMATPGTHRYVWVMDLTPGINTPHRLWIDGVAQTISYVTAGLVSAGGVSNDKVYVGARAGRVVPLKGGVSLPTIYPRILSENEIAAASVRPGGGIVLKERFATDGYNTSPTDTPPNTHWEERVIHPGSFEQSIFSNGTTSGEARAGFGYIELANGNDGVGNNLDRLVTHAVDGRRVTIYALDNARSEFSTRVPILTGIMQQIEVDTTKATIRIKDRLEDLRKPLQPILYLGTSTDGSKTDAEGRKDDLKDKPKPKAWGVNRNVPGVTSNRYKQVLDFASNGVFAFTAVRDRGVALTAGANYATLAELMAATVAAGQYATCNLTGQIKLGSPPAGEITADITEGAAGMRAAPQVVRRILKSAGLSIGIDYSQTDLDALLAIQPAEVGVWIGTEVRDMLPVVVEVLDSIGAYIVPDELGVFRFGRLPNPSGMSGPVIDETIILDGTQKLERLATGDENKGVPAWKVTLEYAPAWTVQSEDQLSNVNSTPEVRAFASQEYRTAVASTASIKDVYLSATEMTFTTLLAAEADALAEAQRKLGIHGVRRDRYRVPLHASVAQGFKLGQIVTLRYSRFGLSAGKPMIVIGRDVTLPHRQGDTIAAGIVILDLFG